MHPIEMSEHRCIWISCYQKRFLLILYAKLMQERFSNVFQQNKKIGNKTECFVGREPKSRSKLWQNEKRMNEL